jgi:hypothetical protein
VRIESGSDPLEKLLLGELDTGYWNRERRGNGYRCAMTTATKHVRCSLLLAVVFVPV